MKNQNTLNVVNISKYYRAKWIIKNIFLEINSNEIIGILGPNGAGKSTLFYTISGLVKLNYGKILLNNEDITRLSIHMKARKGIVYLPQENSIFRNLNVEENIMAILETKQTLSYKKRKKLLELLLKEFNIKTIRYIMGYSLSGGERRKVEIARSIASIPKFVLLDEPFSGIDPISTNEIKNIIVHLKNKNIGILITDHNVKETLDICDHAYIINKGKVLASGTKTEILNNEKVKKIYLDKKFKIS